MTRNDHLSNEVGIEGRLTETGLSARVKSRALAAFDRLIGAVLDVPAAKMEAWANRIRDRDRLESATYDAAVERVEAAVGSDDDSARLVDEVVASRIQAIANKRHVAMLAVEHLASPGLDTEAGPESDAEEVDPDWLNYFGGYAEKASSEKVRDLWARVLAGEIRHPGSFSRATLRLLAELDQQMALWFQQETEFRILGQYILRPVDWSEGRLDRLVFLEQVGLVQHVDPVGGLAHKFEPDQNGHAAVPEGDLCLRMRVERAMELPVIPITHIGQEITKILPPVDPRAVLTRLGQALPDDVKSIDICRILSRDPGGVRVSLPIEVLKPATTDSS